ncbi:MAG: threonine--tRNA ligase, partial [Flavobacteriia bacterium]|nr:threonine--tRNA ligase [Flavobacteriia bacterium]
LPVSEKYNDYAQKVLELLKNSDIRGLIDERNEKVGKKIRDAEVNKYPFMLVVGEKEADSETLSVRQRGTGDLGEMDVQRFIQTVKDEVEKELGKQ